MVWRASRRSGTIQETLPKVWKWSGDPPGGSGIVGRPSWRSGTGQETHPEVRYWSGDPPEVQDWSGDAPRGLEVVRRLSRRT